MRPGKSMTGIELRKLKANHEDGLSNREKARWLERANGVCDNVINKCGKHVYLKQPGGKNLVDERAKSDIKSSIFRGNLKKKFSRKWTRKWEYDRCTK